VLRLNVPTAADFGRFVGLGLPRRPALAPSSEGESAVRYSVPLKVRDGSQAAVTASQHWRRAVQRPCGGGTLVELSPDPFYNDKRVQIATLDVVTLEIWRAEDIAR
jgi:hypothetical protein